MKNIMFSDRYGLTEAVLSGRKTMTRRIVRCPKTFRGVSDVELEYHRRLGSDIWYDCVVCDADGHELGQLPLPFEVGDVVAVAQRYENDDVLTFNAYDGEGHPRKDGHKRHQEMLKSPGYRNKMFVRAELMPHRIRITDLWFERLQDISDEDCLKEGVEKWMDCYIVSGIMERGGKSNVCFDTPREAFAALIDRICGRGTWQSNPWVVAYEFELINKED